MNYIVFRVDTDLWTEMYRALENDKRVFIIPRPLNESMRFLRRMLFSTKLNRIVDVPFKKNWIKSALKKCSFKSEDRVCVLLFDAAYEIYNHQMFEELKKKYKNLKVVFIWENPIDEESMSKFKKIEGNIDAVYTFDKELAKRMNWEYYQFPYSGKINEEENCDISDLYFLGANKGRITLLNNICRSAKNHGLTCDFNVVGVGENDIDQSTGISYNKPLNYAENIRRLRATRCLFESVQKSYNHSTIRTIEALYYRKKLLTTNKDALKNTYATPRIVKVLEGAELTNTDVYFIKENVSENDFPPREEFSPWKLVRKIEDKLDE